MRYEFAEIEKKWRKKWQELKPFRADNHSSKPKYYVLDMFPYPSGAGLHVGHPLGYIASDVIARYKRAKGFNVLHPMGYDSFGLPAEQYAIQTGQHPAITTKENINRYREQLDQIGFSFDWEREVKTSDPSYYKWTQWIFIQLFNSWYNNESDKAEPISTLIETFESSGNEKVNASTDQEVVFTANEWKEMSEAEQQTVLLNYRLTFLSDSIVNWCPELGTVLANDEIKDGLSERGGHPVIQKKMRQWSMRITAYANRLLDDLKELDWTESIKEIQRNWIGKSEGAMVKFQLKDHADQIEVFTTRPDTIFGVTFMVLAPEHDLVAKITTSEQKNAVASYVELSEKRSERERMSDTKTISGVFTGSYVKHPFSGDNIPVWIGDYVLAGYGTGAVMAVPSGDQRDWDFAKHFELPIVPVIEGTNIEEGANDDKTGKLINSDFLNGMLVKDAIPETIKRMQERGFGVKKTNFRLRDAIFSRQRYWGEPIPIYFKDNIPYAMDVEELPLELPEVDKYLPTKEGEPPLARAEDWKTDEGYSIETNTMPGWAGSSWYLFRYMDAVNDNEPFSKDAVDYWLNVDLYIGGAEHATGHLLYSRFWTKFLYDIGSLPKNEPFQKMINQGMIQGVSKLVYKEKDKNRFISQGLIDDYDVMAIHVDVNMVDGKVLDREAFKSWRKEYANAEFVLEEDSYLCGEEVEKMSKRWFNVVNPDDLVNKYGADTLRCYEMFLGPLEQHKPWDTKGVEGVFRFFKKFWRLFHTEDEFLVSDEEANKVELKILHKTIKKVTEDIERYSFNTVVSEFMICTNELNEIKCNKRAILGPLVILISPYAPYIAEELWEKLGNEETITCEEYPVHNQKYLVEDAHKYPISFNGKMRFMLELPRSLSKEEIEKEVLSNENSQKWLDGKQPKKVIVVPNKIVNIVV